MLFDFRLSSLKSYTLYGLELDVAVGDSSDPSITSLVTSCWEWPSHSLPLKYSSCLLDDLDPTFLISANQTSLPVLTVL